jgi:hypothetical protein
MPTDIDSEAQEPDRLDLHAEPTGRGTTFTVTARRPGGEVVTCERLDLAKSKERQKFIADLCDRLGEDAERLLDAEAVERQLAAAAADHANANGAHAGSGRVGLAGPGCKALNSLQCWARE